MEAPITADTMRLYIIITASTSSILLVRKAKTCFLKVWNPFHSTFEWCLPRFTMGFQLNPIKYNLLNIKHWLSLILFRSDNLKLFSNARLSLLKKTNESRQIRFSCLRILTNIYNFVPIVCFWFVEPTLHLNHQSRLDSCRFWSNKMCEVEDHGHRRTSIL